MEEIPPKVEGKLRLLPDQPGIYIWKDAEDAVLYVGKAKSLKHRVRSYWSSTAKDIKTNHLLRYINDLDYIITPSESDAFILESTLIKRHKPKYNILLKDDKRYPFVKITVQDPYPRILITREVIKDGAKYFGPYTDTKSLRFTLRNFEWIFPIRNCTRKIPFGPPKFKKSCINHQLGKCLAPCVGAVDHQEYMRVVKRQIDFFSGKHEEVIDELRAEMNKLSESLQFEKAAAIRDRINAIERIHRRQIVYSTEKHNADVIGIYQEENVTICVVLRILSGAVVNQESYPLINTQGQSLDEILEAFLKLYYSDRDELPDGIILPFEPAAMEELNAWLGHKLSIPQRGDKTKLLAMAKRNAFNLVEEKKLAHLRKANRTVFPIQELKEKLDLPKLPRKIVCMDISTIQGTDTVSSAVFFENAKPKKKYYRHFIIRQIDTQNDYAALQETMSRYLQEVEKDKDLLPDLFVIDGGKGQLAASASILENSSYKAIPVVSLAKRAEEIFTPEASESIILSRSSSSLRLLTTMRDEAHRFAINFHRSRRSKRTLVSELEDIPGIGEQTKFVLLKALGSVENIRKSSIEELCSIKGIGKTTAGKIRKHFQGIDMSKQDE